MNIRIGHLTLLECKEALRQMANRVPVDMILYCPQCNTQHVDEPGGVGRWSNNDHPPAILSPFIEWTNPPHRTHLCHACGHLWRPADVATNGVLRLASGHPHEMKQPRQGPEVGITIRSVSAVKDGAIRTAPDGSREVWLSKYGKWLPYTTRP